MTSRDAFFSTVRKTVFGNSMNQSQVDGINAILDAWDKWAPDSDPRFISYSLATAYWETDRTLQPIAEIGHGRGHSYGVPVGPYNKAYYGRGYVQLTWYANYQKAETKLRSLGVLSGNESLVANPDMALRPEIAAPIMIKGMMEGWFTGRKLGDFFHGSIADWVNARTIINGHDHAAEIAHYAHFFYEGLDEQKRADASMRTFAIPSAASLAAFTPAEHGQSPGIAPAPQFHGFVLGDSIALGTAQALRWPHDAVEGRGFLEIAARPIPNNLDVLVVSSGTNPGHKTPQQLTQIAPSLLQIANRAKAAGVKQIVWIVPQYVPGLLPSESVIVSAFAHGRGEPAITFKTSTPGAFHPDSYAAVAMNVLAALKS